MTSESAPPSIPPRKRPATGSTRPAGAANPGRLPRPAGAAVDTELPPAPGAAYAAEPSREPIEREPAPRVQSSPRSTGAEPPAPADPDEPSPLQVAVGSVASSLKRAAAKTQAALASAAHPRAEERTMSASAATGEQRTVSGSSARPSTGSIRTVPGAPRRVRLALSRIDPLSVMKLSFLLSVAIGIMIVVSAAVVWTTLDNMQVFAKADTLVREVLGAESDVHILQYVEFSRIISAATLIAVIDVFLLTALSTIGAFLYNLVAALVGGVHLTLTDE